MIFESNSTPQPYTPHPVCPCARAQVIDEIGVDLSSMLGAAPQKKVAQTQPAAAAATPDRELDELQARLAMLRN
jgi:hypothetical protein